MQQPGPRTTAPETAGRHPAPHPNTAKTNDIPYLMETTPLRSRILDTIIRTSNLKQKVFDNTFADFYPL